MSIRTMFSVLCRNGLMPLMVLLQVAMACAILCNVLFLVWQRLQPMFAPSGVAGDELVLVDQLTPAQRPWTAAEVDAGRYALLRVPGVRQASAAFGLPMETDMLMTMALQGSNASQVGVDGYLGQGLVQTLGLQLVAGRDFLPSEYRRFGMGAGGNAEWDTGVPQPIIITQPLANKLSDDGNVLGKVLSDPTDKDSHGYLVVGVVRHLLRNRVTLASDGRADNTVLLARNIGNTSSMNYAVRIDPSMREVAMRGIKAAIQTQFGALMGADSLPRISTYAERRRDAFKSQRAALWLFAGITVAVVVVTAIGIMGLTGFWVQRRTRQIGIQRALGARRVDVLRYFLLENFLIVSAGIVLGMALAYLGNQMLMRHYELPHLPWSFLPLGAVVVILLGQFAVLGPALRAAAVSPVVATRSV